MKISKKLHLIGKAIRMMFVGYKVESLRNKIKKHYYTKGIENESYLQRLINKYNTWLNKFNDLDTSYMNLKDSLT